jgi:hypothetical protein
MAATVDESTPPDMATAMVLADIASSFWLLAPGKDIDASSASGTLLVLKKLERRCKLEARS